MLLGLSIGFLGGAALFFRWKARYTKEIRHDAVQRSQAVITGKVSEQLLPYLPGFAFNPKDVRFLGSPVDFLVFDGLASRPAALNGASGGSAEFGLDRAPPTGRFIGGPPPLSSTAVSHHAPLPPNHSKSLPLITTRALSHRADRQFQREDFGYPL